jgi:DNA-binding SARP family transcriptional activator/tetratricopeptide (TPR) repeat protein
MTNRVTLEVRMFGALQVSIAGLPLILRERATKRLLAYLVLQRGVGRTREALVTKLWPDANEPSGRRALRQSLWHLRRALGAEADRLEVRAELVSLRLTAQDRVDVYELDGADVDEREFLDGWTDEWVLEARGTIVAERLERLEALALEAERAGRSSEAVAFARRALKLDELREAMHRVVMRAQLQAGERQRALAQFRGLELQLRELGVDPEPETFVLAQQAQSAVVTTPPLSERTVFIGRQSERAALREAIGPMKHPTTSSGRVVWVEGESGIGKSRLVEEFTRDAARRGPSVLWGDCDESAGEAFQPLVRALQSGLDETKSLWLCARLSAPVLSGLGGVLERFRAPSGAVVSTITTDVALREAFGQLAEMGPMILVLDDLQWADRATLAWLLALSVNAERFTFSLILIARANETGMGSNLEALAQRLAETLPFVSIALEPLGTLEASSLVAQVTDDHQQLQQALQHGRGNPLMLLELARHTWTDETDSTTAVRFKRQIAARLDALDAAARAFLERLAVITSRVPLETFLAEDGLDALRQIESLSRLGLVSLNHEGVEVAHDAMREAIRTHLEAGSATASTQHVLALKLLRRAPSTPAATLAHHAERSQQWFVAAQFRLEAARQALKVDAYELVLEHAEGGLDCLQHAPDDAAVLRDNLREVRLPALEALGRWAELITACNERRHETKDDTVFVQLEARAARALLRLGRFEEAGERANAALTRAGNEPRARLAATAAVGLVAFRSGNLPAAVDARRAAVALSAQHAPELRTEHEYLLANSLIEAGQLEEAKQLLAGVARTHRSSNPGAYADAVARLGVIWTLAHHPGKAEAAYRIAIKSYQAAGKRPAMAATLNNLAILQRALGHIALAVNTHEQALRLYSAMRDHIGETSTRLNLAVLNAVELGQPEGVEAQLSAVHELGVKISRSADQAMISFALASTAYSSEAAIAYLEQHLSVQRPWSGADLSLRLLLARFTARTGRIEQAHDQLNAIATHSTTLEMVHVQLALAEWHIENKDFSEALEMIEQLEATRNTLPRHLSFFLRHRALMGLNRFDEALAALERAHVIALERLHGFSDATVERAMQQALESRPIHQTWQRLGTRLCTVSLPVLGQVDPRGKSARTHVSVHWTPWEYADSLEPDPARRRQRQLNRLIRQARQQGASPTLEALRQAIGTSLATVKRDLARLRLKETAVRLEETGSLLEDMPETLEGDNAQPNP